MVCTVLSGALSGIEGVAVGVEVDLLRRLPGVVIVGLAGGAIRESTERVRSAIQSAGLDFPRKRVVVNLAPAGLKKSGAAFDLPIAVGILAAAELVDCARLEGTCLVGELSLEGRLRPIRGALSLALMAAQEGAKRIILPESCAREAAYAPDIEVLAAENLRGVLRWLDGKATLPRAQNSQPAPLHSGPDMRAVRGQHQARRALEIAAAGGHNLLMIGPPGCGKTMLSAFSIKTPFKPGAIDRVCGCRTRYAHIYCTGPGAGGGEFSVMGRVGMEDVASTIRPHNRSRIR